MNGIKEFQDTSSQAVKGCHFVLMIIYFKERYDGKSLNDPNAPALWIQRWSGDLLKEKTKAEDEDITGLIQRAKMVARKHRVEKKEQLEKKRIQKMIPRAWNPTLKEILKKKIITPWILKLNPILKRYDATNLLIRNTSTSVSDPK
ncbi:hypothetical protein PIB30_099699 [Stylosanthes scabra]|uniref:Uncharacterized protein n=1 Tax=Stylosanthes scabra TaxID=79078 RepID=A0ABU6W0M6_9FABA|nr:hypothetical protein [Stylosanthes scabra]